MTHTMRIMAIDPSSTRTGLAMGTADGVHVEMTLLIRPKPQRAPADRRAASMAEQVDEIVDIYAPDEIVVEIPSPNPPAWMKRAGRLPRGQANYGMAVGYVLGVLLGRDIPVVPVRADLWTRGRSKGTRQFELAVRSSDYDADTDRGADVADALELLEWWVVERAKHSVLRGASGC